MNKTKPNTIRRKSYTVRLNPDILNKLKHLAVDEKETMSKLVEDSIKLFLSKHRRDI